MYPTTFGNEEKTGWKLDRRRNNFIKRKKFSGLLDSHFGLILLSKVVFICKNQQNFNARGITPKRVATVGTHLRGLAREKHSFEETLQRW